MFNILGHLIRFHRLIKANIGTTKISYKDKDCLLR